MLKGMGVGTLEMGASNHKFKVVLIDIARVEDQHKKTLRPCTQNIAILFHSQKLMVMVTLVLSGKSS